jgi:hypothetical protein
VVGHVNHGLRGEESEADARFVEERCGELSVPCVVRCVDVPQRDSTFSEAAARTVRYAALLQMAREHGCSHLATGHTASDNLETILLNFLRGATVEGLGGIKPQTDWRRLRLGARCGRQLASSARHPCARRAGLGATIHPMRVLIMHETRAATNCCRSLAEHAGGKSLMRWHGRQRARRSCGATTSRG